MAYITKEQVKVIRDDLKAVFPLKDGWTFSVIKEDNSAVRVKVMQSPIFEGESALPTTESFYYDDKDKWTTEQKEVGSMITAIIKMEWWDKSEAQIDYFNTAFYITTGIGKWDKGCKMVTSLWSMEDSKTAFKRLLSSRKT